MCLKFPMDLKKIHQEKEFQQTFQRKEDSKIKWDSCHLYNTLSTLNPARLKTMTVSHKTRDAMNIWAKKLWRNIFSAEHDLKKSKCLSTLEKHPGTNHSLPKQKTLASLITNRCDQVTALWNPVDMLSLYGTRVCEPMPTSSKMSKLHH